MHLVKKPYLFLLPLFLLACKTFYHPQQVTYHDYKITAQQPKDTALLQLIQPYSDSVQQKMNEVLGYAAVSLEKKAPAGTLGNFMIDAMYATAKKKFMVPIDAAFMNYGGIRITQLPKGAITRSKVFEIMPFENNMVVQQVSGAVLQSFLDLIAAQGGWPVAGITFTIKDNKAVNIKVQGQPLDITKQYNILNSDYVANGGENAVMLKDVPQQDVGYAIRDALFDYLAQQQRENKNIQANNEDRITYAQ